MRTDNKTTIINSTYNKLAFQWLNDSKRFRDDASKSITSYGFETI